MSMFSSETLKDLSQFRDLIVQAADLGNSDCGRYEGEMKCRL